MKSVVYTAALAGLVPGTLAFWRMECFGRVGVAQIDPIADPDVVAAHAHTIKGSSGLSINATTEDLLNSECTSCQVKQDHSSYWEPQMYFMNANGSVQIVNEIPGHLTYYKYTPVYNSNGTLMMPEALPNGLRVISGDKNRRNFTLPVPDPPRPWTGADATQDALAQKAIGFNCMNYNKAPEGSLYRHFLPDKQYLEQNCPDGIRLEILFPQCWNGELDSSDHKMHLAFPDQGINGGSCPEGYDHNLMQIFYETIYPTTNFVGSDGFYALANGDPTGYGHHGDLFVAWEAGVLQQALELCGSDTTGDDTLGITSDCPVFDMIDQATQQQCFLPDDVQPAVLANMPILSKLPGNNPIQWGPAPASMDGAPVSFTGGYQSPTGAVVPTQTYSVGTENILAHSPATPAPAPPPTTSVVAAAAPTTVAKNQVTAAPAVSDAAAGNPDVSTTYYTSDGVVYEEVIVEEVVYVTDIDVVTMSDEAAQRKREHRARHLHGQFHQH